MSGGGVSMGRRVGVVVGAGASLFSRNQITES